MIKPPRTFESVIEELQTGLSNGSIIFDGQKDYHHKRWLSRIPSVPEFIRLLIPARNREHILGDLEEEYRTVVLPHFGHFSASIWYWAQTLGVVGSFLWQSLKRAMARVLNPKPIR